MEFWRALLGWCCLINLGILLFWWALFVSASDAIYALHRLWCPLSRQTFDTVHYCAMAFFKLSVLLLNVVPYAALCLMGF